MGIVWEYVLGRTYKEDIQRTIDLLRAELPKYRENFPEIIEDPNESPSSWRPKLSLKYAKANDGTSPLNTAIYVNKFDVGFPRARLRFVMPKGAQYRVSKGIVEQAFDGDAVHVVDVRVAIEADSETSIEIYSTDKLLKKETIF